MHLKQPVQKRLIEFQDEYKKNIAKVAADRVSSAVKQSKLEEEARVATILGKANIEVHQPEPGIPVITERSQRKHREYHDCLSWGEEQTKKKEEMREKFEEMEMAEVRSKPVISSRSKNSEKKREQHQRNCHFNAVWDYLLFHSPFEGGRSAVDVAQNPVKLAARQNQANFLKGRRRGRFLGGCSGYGQAISELAKCNFSLAKCAG